MLIQPVSDIAIAVEVIFTAVRVQAHQHGILVGIHTDAIFTVIAEAALWVRLAVGHKAGAVSQKQVISGISAQSVDHLIETGLEVLRVQLCVVIVP